MTSAIIAATAVGITAVVSGGIFWMLSKRTRTITVKVARVNDSAYWKIDNKWYTAPIITVEGNIEVDHNNTQEIDLDTATPEELNLLMEILERFEH